VAETSEPIERVVIVGRRYADGTANLRYYDATHADDRVMAMVEGMFGPPAAEQFVTNADVRRVMDLAGHQPPGVVITDPEGARG
jgi:hypothetical protein